MIKKFICSRTVAHLVFLIVLCSPFFGYGQSKYQGLFLYQFSKYIKWPDTYGAGSFVIDVIGDDEAYKSISEMAQVKKETQGMNIIVNKVASPAEINKPHIIFIQKDRSNTLADVLQKVKNDPVLIVTESPGLAEKGSIINFVEKDGKMRFEINQGKAEAVGLKVSGSLLSLAIIV